jgi:coenzyme F420 hydrogenase subunit beta
MDSHTKNRQTVEPGSLSRLLRTVMQRDLCTGCGACAGTCPYLIPTTSQVVALDRCSVDTGHCIRACPRANPWESPSNEAFGPWRSIHKAWAARETDRAGAQHGGVTTALIAWLLASGDAAEALLVGGTVLTPEPSVAGSVSAVHAAKGIKYVVVPHISRLNRRAARDVSVVVALPCQVQGLERMSSSNVPAPIRRPIIIGLFCSGAFRLDALRRAAHAALETRLPKRLHVIHAGAAEGGAVTANARQLAAEVASGEVISLGVDPKAASNPACSTCPDLTAEGADISIGAHPADTRANLVVVRSERGASIWTRALADGIIIAHDVSADDIQSLASAALEKRAHANSNIEARGPSAYA